MKNIYTVLSILILMLAQCGMGLCAPETIDSLVNRMAEDQKTLKQAQPSTVATPAVETPTVSTTKPVAKTKRPKAKLVRKAPLKRVYKRAAPKPVVSVKEVVGKNAPPVPKPIEESPKTEAVGTTAVPNLVKPEGLGAVPTAPKREDKIALFIDAEEKGKPVSEKSGGAAKTIFRTIFSLALVCGLAYVTMLLLKKLQGKSELIPRSSKNLQIVDTVKLTPNSGLYLINMRGKTMLVGCSSEHVSLLREFETEELREDAEPTDGRFAEYLEKYSESPKSDDATGRVAGLLRDCTTYLKGRQYNALATSKARKGKNDEA